jgi:hypothetical protein
MEQYLLFGFLTSVKLDLKKEHNTESEVLEYEYFFVDRREGTLILHF